MKPQTVNAADAPQAIGPYSHASVDGDLVFCSGQVPLDPESMKLVEGGVKEQTEQVLTNLKAVLAAVDCTFVDVAKTTIFLTDMADFPVVNEIYGAAFGEHKPARATVAVAGLPLGSLVEIECIAHKS